MTRPQDALASAHDDGVAPTQAPGKGKAGAHTLTRKTFAETYAAFKRGREAQAALRAELMRLNAMPVDVRADLERQVRDWLEENREETWDDAIKAIMGGNRDEDEDEV